MYMKNLYNFLCILLVMLMMSCTGSYHVTSDNSYPLSNYDYHYYDEYYDGYHPYPFYYQYRNYQYYHRNYYSVPQQNSGVDQLNRQRGVRPSRTVIVPLGPPRRNVTPMRTPSRSTPNRQVTPTRTPSRTGRGN
jgi:hypothetical protein